MILKSLKLINFRNYDQIAIDFHEGINYVVGPNGSGKTNLVEGIYYLSLARSFRTTTDDNLVKIGRDYFYIGARVSQGDQGNNLEIYYNNEGKRILINKKKASKISELASVVNCIVFTPKDVFIMQKPPKSRRFFLNLTISKVSSRYQKLITDYEKVLKERNKLLKETKVDKILLEVMTEQLIDFSYDIYSFRKMYIEQLEKATQFVFKTIDDSNRKIKIVYLPLVNNKENYKSELKEKYAQSLEKDIKTKTTNIGIHREDFLINLDGKNVAMFGSQGENRLVSLSLKLAPYFLVSDYNVKPLVILDDVLSELDERHENLLIEFLKSLDQVFITGTRQNSKLGKTNYLLK